MISIESNVRSMIADILSSTSLADVITGNPDFTNDMKNGAFECAVFI